MTTKLSYGFFRQLVTGVIAVWVLGGAAYATPKTVAVYKDWIVYKQDLEGDIVCYAITEPTDKSPASLRHGDVFFIVASWKSGVATNQPSFMTGYDLRAAPEPVIRVGAEKWSMYTSQIEAFIDRASDEKRLVAAMRRGSTMRLSAVSAKGNATNYTFSLLGISSALDRVAKTCQ